MKPLKLKTNQWRLLKSRLEEDYPPSVMLIRSKMRNVLGFTPREHVEWNEDNWENSTMIHLDFFDEPKRTMFLLKYSEFLQHDN